MKFPRSLDQRGVTIVELAVALVLTTIMVGIIIGFAVDKQQQSSQQTIKNDLLTNAETGLNTVANDIRLSARADDNNRWQDANAPGAPSNQLSWQSNGNTLVLATAAQDSNHNILFDDVHDYVTTKNNYVYFVSNHTLYKRTLAASKAGNAAKTTCPASLATSTCPADKEILDNVNSFAIQYYDGDNQTVTPSNARSVQLTVQLLVHKYNQDFTTDYTTRMVFRNG